MELMLVLQLSHRYVTLFEAASLDRTEALNAVSMPERHQLQIVDHHKVKCRLTRFGGWRFSLLGMTRRGVGGQDYRTSTNPVKKL